AYAQAMMLLARILGRTVSDQFELPEMPEDVAPQDLAIADQAAQAGVSAPLEVSRHPSLEAMTTSIDLAEVENLSSYGALLPNVNFTYTYSWLTNDTVMPDEDTSWTMGIGVEIPLFEGLGRITGIGQTQQQVRSTRLQVEDYNRSFLQRAHAARLNLRAARLRVISARKATKHTAANLEIVNSRAQLGMATNLEQLDAQFAYRSAQSDLISAVSDFYIALAEWEYVTASTQNDTGE
ncbi:MAG: TolC family protein, partial [Alphaproteobacteria bacterium]